MIIKRLDKLMAKSFAGPFVVTFAIAIFVLMMQVLWVYLDDIAGKGLGFFTVLELMAYKCVGLVPLALPLALLISSVMVLGGMAEHYELSSFKSAGTSLLRVMRPLILFGIISAGVSFACADYVIPAANLQFGARMYDIQQKKPTLSMEPGVFNDDFSQSSIRLGKRSENGRDIADILIYDHTKASTGDLGQIVAKTGEMYSENDGSFFVMKLYDGYQYSERKNTGKNRSSLPFVRTRFDSYTKVFDLSEFKLGKTNETLFRTNRSMLATWQLQEGVDSIDIDIAVRKQTISNHVVNYLPLARKDTTVYREKFAPQFESPDEDDAEARTRIEGDSTAATSSIKDIVDQPATGSQTQRQLPQVATRVNKTPSNIVRIENAPTTKPKNATKSKDEKRAEVTFRQTEAKRRSLENPLVQYGKDWPGVSSIMDSLEKTAFTRVINRARSAARSITSQAQSTQRILPGVRESRVKHIYDMHMKYSLSLVCIIFIFIGAPMGAIVRKGGFGYPILVSIIFFVIFIILTIFCRKLAESFVVNGAFAGWLPCIILFPVSLYITSRALKDAKLVSTDGITRLFSWAKGRVKRQEEPGDGAQVQ
ncbi:LptF/LptG family permease [Neolewinella agarilytica]|uniref:LptF/LptG family permease n=1 Tax=Neolewinella agarilytica TaxID=478744 RepID=UPI00235759D0|nr:LptF/LptG family permease [Neolewinella agarilytica]